MNGRTRTEEEAVEGPGGEAPLADVVRAAAAGDGAATATVLRRVAPRLVRVVRAVLGAAHPDVDDACQVALIGFVQALPGYRGEGEPEAYARIIAVRAALATRRRAWKRDGRNDDVDTDSLTTSQPLPADLSRASERRRLLRELLAALPAEQAESLAMRVILGCSLDEVAVHTGVSVNTVRSRLRLAKERLKSRILGDESLREALEVNP